MQKPNILLLTIDTLRRDRLGCYGWQPSLTPHLDRLAAESVRFEQALTGGSWTQAAFPVMLTSTYASMYGGCTGRLSAERPSPITTLSEQGYMTGGFSTSPLLSKDYAYHRGFDYFHDLNPGEHDPLLRKMKGGQKLLRQPMTHRLSKLVGQQTRPPKLYATAHDLYENVTDWITRADGYPFFAWVHYMDVHWPYHLEETLETPDEIAQAWRDLAHLHDANWHDESISPEQKAHYIALYEKALQFTDQQVGKLLTYVRESGLMENTIIIVVSDHGEEFLEHGRWGHWENNLYDEILRIPLLFYIPQLGQKRVERQVRTLDIMPTVLELAGATSTEPMLGESLVKYWQTDESQYPEAVSVSEMWRAHWHIIAVRTAQWKYIWDSQADPELYDLQDDPQEQNNLASEQPDKVAELHKYVEERLADMEATRPDTADEDPELNEEMLSRLRGLGYVE